MKTLANSMPIVDYCQGLDRDEYQVNRQYQRSNKVWPSVAKSFLIETILLDFPIPKLSLHQKLDLLSRRTVKDIVDGQQRTGAIREFYQNRLRLSRSLETEQIAGRTFDELEDEDKSQFLSYALNFDIFVNATDEDVREVFRRMNSFTVPLNSEETRHATYQGPFKWFILKLTGRFDQAFEQAGVFNERQLYRMADAKLLTEITHALVHGITTTNKRALDGVYKEFDNVFTDESAYFEAIANALEWSLTEPTVRETDLSKPLQLYSLILAHIQVRSNVRVPTALEIPAVNDFRANDPEYNLSILADALANPEVYEQSDGPLSRYLAASREGTNVAAQRRTRFEFFVGALGG